MRSVLRLGPSLDVVSFVLPSTLPARPFTILFPSACEGEARWEVSPAVSAAHGLALLTLLFPLTKCPLPSVACMNTLRSLYVVYSRDLLSTLAGREAQVPWCCLCVWVGYDGCGTAACVWVRTQQYHHSP